MYIDNELSGREREEITAHIKGCNECSLKLHEKENNINSIFGSIDELEPVDLSVPDFFQNIKPRKRHLRPITLYAEIAAIFLIVFLLTRNISFNDNQISDEQLRFLLEQDIYTDFGISPNQMWQDKSLIITIYDEEKKQSKVVITSKTGEDKVYTSEIN